MFSRNRTATVLAVATVVMASFVLTATSALAATIEDTEWATTTDTTQDYITELSAGTWTWTIDSGVIVTLGNNTNNSGRLFVGINTTASVNQTLILTSTDGGGTLNLFGNHSLDPVLGRLGHVGDTGTIVINGGVSLIGGSNPFRYSSTTGNAITINNGLVDFTGNGNTPFDRESNGFLTFNIADNMATLIVPGQIDDAADFAATWAGASVAASGSNPLSFDFDSTANKTTIAAVPEAPLALAIAQSGSDLVFTWNSQPGKLYDLLGSTTLDTPPSTPWPVYNDGLSVTTDLAADPSGTNALNVPRPADAARFFSILQKDAPPDPSENLALRATASGRGVQPAAAIDGIKNEAGRGEWIGGSPNTWYGWIDYPSLQLTWRQPVTVNKVILHDRPDLGEHLAGAILKFSDGTEVSVTAIPNDGSPRTLVFPPREITSLILSAVDGVGTNIGLSEIEVFHDPEAVPPLVNRTFTDFVSHVDPTIETGRGRWFFCTPGSLPFGMISASAYTRNKNQGGGGYNYNSTEIRGFTQQKCWIMSSVNLMPVTGDISPNQGEAGWLSKFSHDTEIIEPGYHQVFLDRYQTKVEYTATERVAYYRLTYKEAAQAKILLQLGGFVGSASYVDGHATMISPTRIEGYHGMTDRLWGGPELSHVHFVIETDRPIARMDGWKGPDQTLPDIQSFANPVTPARLQEDMRKYLFKNLPEEQAGVSLAYDVAANDVVNLKIAISFTNIENARNNLAQDGAEDDFDKVRAAARATWNEWLGKIAVEGGSAETRVKFYTDLWHVLLGRHRLDDASGDYPSFMPDNQFRVRSIAKDSSGKPLHPMFNSDALWLTQWNLNILWGLGWPDVMDDFSASWAQYARDGGHLPRGPSAGGYTGIMRGSPGTSLLAATYQKGLMRKTDPLEAWQMMKQSNERLIRLDAPGVAVQGSFEYWALAQMAEDLGLTDEAASFRGAIDSWRNFFNQGHKLLMAPGVNNPLSGQGWVEANAWQGTFGVSHDIPGLAALMGGNEALADKLNHAFETEAPNHFVFTYGAGHISYANQPGCSNAHVFNHAGHPWLSQYWTRRVSRQAYGGTDPNTGYGGHDEDQGQMGGVSALMKLGLFSLRGTASKDPVYEITAPEFDQITIRLDPRYYPGETFTIRTHGNAEANCYIQRAELNGQPLDSFHFPHSTFAAGGLLELWLGPEPNRQWGVE